MTSPVMFITGAASGIGLATARLLAAAENDLVLMDLQDEDLAELAHELSSSCGVKAVSVGGDMSDEADMDQAVHAITSNWGRLDAVVVNAGINGVWAPIDDLTPEEWDRTIRINLRGTYMTINRTVPLLKKSGGGAIAVVASINGVRTFTNPGATAYSASKAAQVAMVQQLALELGRHGIRVNVVCPGAIDTNIASSSQIRHREQTEIPVVWPEGSVPITGGEPGRAEDVARIIGFLLSDASAHMTGSPVFVDGGQGLLR
jgi:NAD(P)-dependent dehydrogenase (short-subunit alcohol dehydrogenase family)